MSSPRSWDSIVVFPYEERFERMVAIQEIVVIFYKNLVLFLSITLTVARSVFRDLLVPPEPPEKDRSEKPSGSMRTKPDSLQKPVFKENLPILLLFYYVNRNRILNKSRFWSCFTFVLIDPGSFSLRCFSGGSGGTSRPRKTLRATVRVMLKKKDKVLVKNIEIFLSYDLSFKRSSYGKRSGRYQLQNKYFPPTKSSQAAQLRSSKGAQDGPGERKIEIS